MISEYTEKSSILFDKSNLSRWSLQIQAILRIEVSKNFWGRRALLLYLLALAPVAILSCWRSSIRMARVISPATGTARSSPLSTSTMR